MWFFTSLNRETTGYRSILCVEAPTDDLADSDRTESRDIFKVTWQINPANKLMDLSTMTVSITTTEE